MSMTWRYIYIFRSYVWEGIGKIIGHALCLTATSDGGWNADLSALPVK